MAQIVTFGLGGWCEHCDESHDHPLNNIIEIREVEEPETPVSDVQAIAEALVQLPPETLDALKQALGIGVANG